MTGLLQAFRQPLRVVDVTRVRDQPLTDRPHPGVRAFAERYAPSFYLDVGTACPLHCVYCSVERGPNDTDVRMEAAEHLYERMADAESVGIRKLAFIGGEAASRPDLWHLCDVAMAMGFEELTLTTKSVKLARPAFVEALRAHQVRQVHLSLDSFDPGVLAIHLRSTTAPRALLTGLDELLRQRVDTFLYIVLTRHSLPGLPAYIARVAALQQTWGVALPVVVTPLKLQSRAERNMADLLPAFADIATVFAHSAQLAETLGVTLVHKSVPPCIARGWGHLAMETYLTEGRLEVGSGRALQSFRGDDVVRGPACATCVERDRCGGVDRLYVAERGWGEFVPLSD